MGWRNDGPYISSTQTTDDSNDGNNINDHTVLPRLRPNDYFGITITRSGDPENNGTGGQQITFKHYNSTLSGGIDLVQKYIPTHYFSASYKLYPLSDFDGSRTHEGAWCVFVFDSTTGYEDRYVSLEVVERPY